MLVRVCARRIWNSLFITARMACARRARGARHRVLEALVGVTGCLVLLLLLVCVRAWLVCVCARARVSAPALEGASLRELVCVCVRARVRLRACA